MKKTKLRILDICCGSGCIGIALKHFMPQSDIVLADISDSALNVAQKNARLHKADVTVVKADLLLGYENCFQDGEFDIIVSNPPYIKKHRYGFFYSARYFMNRASPLTAVRTE